MTSAEAARMLGIHRTTFERRWADGTLQRYGVKEANRLTWKRFFDRASIEAAMWKKTVTR